MSRELAAMESLEQFQRQQLYSAKCVAALEKSKIWIDGLIFILNTKSFLGYVYKKIKHIQCWLVLNANL